MKKLLLLGVISFLVLNANDVSAKCHWHTYFNVGSYIYNCYSDNGCYNFDAHLYHDTLVNPSQPISIQIEYEWYNYGPCQMGTDSNTAYIWSKNGREVSSARMYTVTDTGLYEG